MKIVIITGHDCGLAVWIKKQKSVTKKTNATS